MMQTSLSDLFPRPIGERRADKRSDRGEQRRQPDIGRTPPGERDYGGVDSERQREEERAVEKSEDEHTRQRQEKVDECVDHRSVVNNATAIPVITSVAVHPRNRSRRGNVNWPITAGRSASSMIAIMIGALAMPLMTALQKSALIGSKWNTLRTMPAAVAIAISR